MAAATCDCKCKCDKEAMSDKKYCKGCAVHYDYAW